MEWSLKKLAHKNLHLKNKTQELPDIQAYHMICIENFKFFYFPHCFW